MKAFLKTLGVFALAAAATAAYDTKRQGKPWDAVGDAAGTAAIGGLGAGLALWMRSPNADPKP